jgi:pterin-4a-carbinolamine dehydratase
MSDSDFIQLVKDVTDLVDKMAELSYTTAEHHPYWKLLYSCVEISRIVLERWNDEISTDDVDEIRWMISELQNSLNKLTNEK